MSGMGIDFECQCGKKTYWNPKEEAEAEVRLKCDSCGSLYALAVTQLLDGTTR